MNPSSAAARSRAASRQALGGALFEEVLLGADGAVTTDASGNYHMPQFADVPRTEVFFAETYDALGPLGAKSMSESAVQPGRAGAGQRRRRATGPAATSCR